MPDFGRMFLRLKYTDLTKDTDLYIVYTGCPGRNMPDFGRMFLKLKYTDLTQNTDLYIVYTVSREECARLWENVP